VKFLFVCLGNICRSPTAHGVLEDKLLVQGIDWVDVDSAGTAAYHIGKEPDVRTQKIALSHGYDLSNQRARQLCENDFFEFDQILAMDESNLQNIIALAPANSTAKLQLALNITDSSLRDIPDPYYSGEEGFYEVLKLSEAIADSIILKLIQDH